MATCQTCGGEGSQTSMDDEEAIRGIRDACYHCSTTGICNDRCCTDPQYRELFDKINNTEMYILRMDEYADRDVLDEEGWAKLNEAQNKLRELKAELVEKYK